MKKKDKKNGRTDEIVKIQNALKFTIFTIFEQQDMCIDECLAVLTQTVQDFIHESSKRAGCSRKEMRDLFIAVLKEIV